MNKLKIGLFALAALALSAGAQARGHGHDRHRHDHGRHWQRPVVQRVVYQAPRCASPVVYVPVRKARPVQVSIQPGVQIHIALGF